MNHRLHSFTLPSGLSSGAGLYPEECTEMGSKLTCVQPANDPYPHFYNLWSIRPSSSWPIILGWAGMERPPCSGAALDVTLGPLSDSLDSCHALPLQECFSHFSKLLHANSNSRNSFML